MPIDQSSFRRYGRFYKRARKYASRREVLISTYLILSLFTISFFAAVFIRPTAVTIAKLWREIQDKRSISSRLEKKIRDLEQAQSLYISIENDLIYLDRALPSSPEFSLFVREIEYLAAIHGLQLSTGSYGTIELYSSEEATPSSSELIEYPFSLSVQGSYSQLRSFISDVEQLDRIVTLHTVGISPIEKKEIIGQFELALTIESTMYSFAEGADLK